jgi:hypothetical protein
MEEQQLLDERVAFEGKLVEIIRPVADRRVPRIPVKGNWHLS